MDKDTFWNIQMTCRKAIEILQMHGTAVLQTGAAPQEAELKEALLVAQAILEQKGCECHEPACDGTLTNLMDIVIWG